MFIYTGLLKAVDNEAQLAGVMGHEMSHVILRHGTHEATKANGLQVLAGGLASLLGGGKLVQAGLGLTANSFILKFSRDAESMPQDPSPIIRAIAAEMRSVPARAGG